MSCFNLMSIYQKEFFLVIQYGGSHYHWVLYSYLQVIGLKKQGKLLGPPLYITPSYFKLASIFS